MQSTTSSNLPPRLPRLRRIPAACCALLVLAGSSTALMPAMAQDTAPINGYAEHLKPRSNTKSNRKAQIAGPGARPYEPVQRPSDEGQIPEIEMFVGESRVFPAPGVARIAVGNGSILTAAALDEKEVILFANGMGTSSLFIWNADGRYQRVKINIVPGDTSRIAREIAAFLTSIPKARASIIGDKVIVEGEGLSMADLARIDMLAQRYPQIVNFTSTLGVEKMVMLDVKVVEFPTSALRELGLSWRATGGVAVGGIWSPIRRGRGDGFQIGVQTGSENTPPMIVSDGSTLTLPKALHIGSLLNLGLNATLNALAQEGKTTILAEPQLSARNGASASFLAGGEIPYSVRTNEGPSIEFKQYGVRLDILPRVDNTGNVHAQIAAEVSSIDPSISTEFGPGLLSRKTNTEFNVRQGETIVLSGLIQRETSVNTDRVPGLSNIPILGALFRSKSFQNKETELVIFVTPTVVDAQSPGIVDRIERTTERLQERLGAAPYLSNPLQPGVDMARPDISPAAATPPDEAPEHTTNETAAAPPPPLVAATPFDANKGSTFRVLQDGLALRARPDLKGRSLLLLDRGAVVTLRAQPTHETVSRDWLPVQTGTMQGWVQRTWVTPVRLELEPVSTQPLPAAQPVPLAAGTALTLDGLPTAGSYRVLARMLPLMLTPDRNAPVQTFIPEDQIVDALAVLERGAWTAVQYQGQRGWVASPWLQPVQLLPQAEHTPSTHE
ncbi:pilus assembly protein N-terminal domain-containing protein [Comamonas nitrativorans]|uniref:Pilus assembly protein N-terminal domain-containing protein n=1 Tax=Comamonas nitrativorans TaxID=108437 RepID=A0ABV9GWD4_9BURK